MTVTARAYGAAAIKVLEGLDVVRKRPGMYIGSTSERGLHHMLWEVVDNGVDEAMAGHATRVEVRLLADGGAEVTDNGRGIPVAAHATGMPTIDVVMTQLHAGGKFGAEGGAYAVSGGLHGVGVSVVNALSTRLEAEISRDGYRWSQQYLAAIPQTLTRGRATTETGTTVRYWADPEVFETTDYNFDTVARRLREMAFLNSGLEMTLTDERRDGEDACRRFHYPGGLREFARYLNRSRQPLHPTVIEFRGRGIGYELEVALQWNTGFTESVHTFANTINTSEGGVHEEGFRAALTTVVNRCARKMGLLKASADNLTGDDVREGLAAVVSVKVAEPQFEGQTKTRLGNSAIRSFVQKVSHEKLTEWFDANPAEAKLVISKVTSTAQARAAARKARELVRRKNSGGLGGSPGKLADCRTTDASRAEIFIVEGDSAGGSAKSGRDSMFQAILPIRGKIINVEKARIDQVLKNTEVQSIITAFGTGIREEFDITRLRYHKIVLMADADVDGKHIATLLLTLLFRYTRPLVELGHVYLAQPPLYKLKWQRGDPDYAYSDLQRDRLLAAGTRAGRRMDPGHGIQRYKGLGEMNPQELWETTMDPATRALRRLTIGDAALAEEIFAVLMGEDVEARRGFITRNAGDSRFLDI
ncbi:DNA topoisomerase (ATP-hydrolyzing) subunit B [Nocardia caishijiensis]|uniref:DNA gyrase subunit B n=1 Tax=Nocardia caishijiensis TaxID=184756 RepID=A0ABQ6YHH7_9NOCA|nr:DNA topoisomerase (ATP-hydrolyzing) subunit B [Nocardia caishijiensis]KAF0845233.1 DNA gyrase subunit B [Nocardia caishijiensis]